MVFIFCFEVFWTRDLSCYFSCKYYIEIIYFDGRIVGQESKFSSKIEFLVNRTLVEKSKFWAKYKFWLKIYFLSKSRNWNFGRKIEIENFVEKSKFWSKNRNFAPNKKKFENLVVRRIFCPKWKVSKLEIVQN